MEMATASKIENNAFIVLTDSFLTAQMRLPARIRVAALSRCAPANIKNGVERVKRL